VSKVTIIKIIIETFNQIRRKLQRRTKEKASKSTEKQQETQTVSSD
jgi:hypothetical protein